MSNHHFQSSSLIFNHHFQSLRSGKRLHSCGKSPFLVHKSTISMAMFYVYVLSSSSFGTPERSCRSPLKVQLDPGAAAGKPATIVSNGKG
jgi:hypothetical protein